MHDIEWVLQDARRSRGFTRADSTLQLDVPRTTVAQIDTRRVSWDQRASGNHRPLRFNEPTDLAGVRVAGRGRLLTITETPPRQERESSGHTSKAIASQEKTQP